MSGNKEKALLSEFYWLSSLLYFNNHKLQYYQQTSINQTIQKPVCTIFCTMGWVMLKSSQPDKEAVSKKKKNFNVWSSFGQILSSGLGRELFSTPSYLHSGVKASYKLFVNVVILTFTECSTLLPLCQTKIISAKWR